MLRELLHRRVPQFLIAYLVAGWGLVQVLQFVEDRYALSPAWVDLFAALWLLLIPGIMVCAWSHGAPGQDRWTRRQVVSIGINVVAAVALLVISFSDRDLGAVTTEVALEDENGQEVLRQIPKADYRKSLALFHPEDATDDPEHAWWVGAATYLVELDLFQDASLNLRSAYQNREAAQRRGVDDPCEMPRPMRREIAQASNMDYFLDGKVESAGEQVVLTLNVNDVHRGRVVASDSWTGDIYSVCDQGSAWARQQLGIPAAALAVSPDLPVADLTTDSPEALRAFIEGLDRAFEIDLEGAEPHFARAVEIDPTFCLAHMQRYGTLVFGTNQAGARASIEAAMAHAYRVPERMQFLIKSTYYSAAQDQEKAMAVLEMWARLSPRDPVVHNLLAQQYRYRGQPDKAIASLERVVELLPEDAGALGSLAENYEDRAEFAKAEEIHRRVVKLNPDQASGLRALARCFEKQGRLDEARGAYEDATLLEPGDESLQCEVATLLGKQGEYAEAEKRLRELAETARSDLDRLGALDDLGTILLVQGKVDAAVAVHESWVELGPKVLSPGQFLIRQAVETAIFAKDGRGEEGLERVETIRQSVGDPFDRFVRMGDAVCYVEMEEPAAARPALAVVREVTEQFGLAAMQPTLDYYEARILELEGKPEEGLALVADDVTLLGGRAQRLRLRGRLQRLSGQLDASTRTLEECVRLAPGYPDARLELAKTLHARGKVAEARAELENALRAWADADPDYDDANDARSLREIWRAES